ncbi:MAG: alanine--tRNA ligase [Pontiellaceae bacterium]|nr:alanine--tRNA ligase [Pontiellaceae bacterium]MBN2784663.1 alanine--tRNA ligase [Pontiellaceae bacterium]
MTSKEIRQSFLDFFESKQHTLVKSASLMPDAPNLLFTNAGMNQFVPIFLGQANCPYEPGRAADTQKCIRAGGKHNDLEDVGADTYHHTFFEMLGNWSFGDYFKQEAIDWAWELLVKVWGFPVDRLYATYFGGDDKTAADLEAKEMWLKYLPAERVVPGNRKDNFWMMGDTGPCGPCSEIHIDLTPNGDAGAKMVNADSADLIEIWNLVFIQFNANPDGSYTPLPAQHVDTGMGFERACSIIQCTNGFSDFSGVISNYETDVFTPIFRSLEEMSGKKYGSSMTDPADIAFRVIADHIRCLSFAIADGIIPSNEGRGYVLRRILRRAVRVGRVLGFKEPFFYKLAETVAANFGEAFPELRKNLDRVTKTLKAEEDSFNRTLDRGIELFDQVAGGLSDNLFPADEAFKLYDTFGFPIDLTEVMARERGISVDTDGFEKLMDEQRERARADYKSKKSVVMADGGALDVDATIFVGYESTECEATILEVLESGAVILDKTPFYGESGGQQGDHGTLKAEGVEFKVQDAQKTGDGIIIHSGELVSGKLNAGDKVTARVCRGRRDKIRRNHTSTHLLNQALREVVDSTIKQAGSLVASDYLRFDFNYFEAVKPEQLREIERVVNKQILRNTLVGIQEMSLADVQKSDDIQAVFDDKYGDTVRVVSVGDFSKELCGGTHVSSTGQIGQFRIVSESSVAAGIRRIEAVTGLAALEWSADEHELLSGLSQSLSVKPADLPGRIKAMAEQVKSAEKQLKEARMKAAVHGIEALLSKVEHITLKDKVDNMPLLAATAGEVPMDALRELMDRLRQKLESGVIILGSHADGKACFMCSVSDDLVKEGIHAGKLIGAVAKLAGGGGGGKPDKAQAGGKDGTKVVDAIKAVPGLLTDMHS